MERRLRGILCEGARPFPDFSLKISDNLWWWLKSSRSSSKPLLLPNVQTEEMTWVSTLVSPSNEATGEACSPVVCFDEVVLHQDLVHSHHQDGVDIILGANTGSRGELGRLVLVNRKKSSWIFFLQEIQTKCKSNSTRQTIWPFILLNINICTTIPHDWHWTLYLILHSCYLKHSQVLKTNLCASYQQWGVTWRLSVRL